MKRLAILALIAFFCCLAAAQSASTATIVGQVLDPQGAVVPDATVIATSTATGVGRSVITTATGNYTIPNLPAGNYSVRVEHKGFATGEIKNVLLNVGNQRDLSFKLAIAGSMESIEVTTSAPLIESTKTDVSSTVTNLDMERLPTFAGTAVIGGAVNDYAQLALTAPGVKSDTSGLTTGDLIAPGSTNNRGNLYNVDGANITDQLVSGRDSTGASVDEVQEFQVITNTYNAEYGQATGLVLNAVTKSGTNGVHGDAHAYFRGRNLASSDPFYNLGFLDQTTGLIPATETRCPANRIGTSDIDGCARAPFNRAEGGFTLGGPFIKDKLFWFTSYEISQQEQSLILTPFGTSQSTPQPVHNLLYSGKIDYKIDSNNTLTARYAVDRLRITNQIVQTGANVTPDDLTAQTINNASVNVGFISSLTPTIVNEARFVFFRFVNSLVDNTTVPGVIQADGTQTGANFCCPQGGEQKRYQYIDNLTWTHGTHTMKYGFNISYYPWTSLFQQFHFGQYTVDSNGAPTSFTFGTGPGEVTSKDNIYGFYAQDTWKVTRKLTVNYGLRWDYEAGAFKGGPIHGPNSSCFQANGLIPACSKDLNNFQPRIGFTYAIGNRTLLHAAAAETTMLAFNNVVLDSLNFDGITLNTATSTDPAVLAAFPNQPNPALLVAPVCPPDCGRVRPISTHLRNPEMRSVNVGVEHQFTNTLKAEVQYIGQFGFGLFGERDTNAPPLLTDPAHPGFFFYGPRPNQNFTPIRTNENSRTSHYNGLLVSAQKRMSNHIQFNASYTWSHALTSGEDFFGISEPGDFVNIRPELGPAYNDIRHAVNMGVVLDSGKMFTGFTGKIMNNLGLSWLGQIQSGRPYPLSTGSSQFGNGSRFFGSGSETQQRPNILPDGTVSVAGIGTFDGFAANFGPNAPSACLVNGGPAAVCNAIVPNTFLAPATADPNGPIDAITGEVVDFKFPNGGVERNVARGDPFLRFDASLHKDFVVPQHDNIRIELRFDAFNVFNSTNYNSFNSNDVLTALPLSTTTNAAGGIVPNPDFFTCVGCQRPDGTFVGLNGQALHLNDLRSGRVSHSLLASQRTFNGLGDPGANDLNSIGPRKLQLSFHVRF
ncbi:MAG TPA: carboxypeptidase regulatory-like domain-containing protein [Verrucomicrobiae bacterium]|nr:carboxypeptidase regulatory-like domain-containing protein [Verrucomicrobiae bacterium]